MDKLAPLPMNPETLKAECLHRGRLLLRFRLALKTAVDECENEGDRIYFGSTNHFDDLKDISEWIDEFGFRQFCGENDERDVYGDLRQLHERNSTLKDVLVQSALELDEAANLLVGGGYNGVASLLRTAATRNRALGATS